ncbi:MAG: GNAT family N-acetyltransferase [Treponema sp.]|nr:GNAT family N-acetyltransferase [Treponema sp.]
MKTWFDLRGRDAGDAEALLREQETYCAGAAYRFIKRGKHDRLWISAGGRALLLYVHRILFPVLGFAPLKGSALLRQKTGTLILPDFFPFIVRNLHAMQGLEADMAAMEARMEKLRLLPSGSFDYDLMHLHKDPVVSAIPSGLDIRRAEAEDFDNLLPLQIGYELEEVLPKGERLNPVMVKNNLKGILLRFYTMIAGINGKPVGKININAESFNYLQIGGVYVDPAYRGLGIGAAMTQRIIQDLLPCGKKFTLFVKKKNYTARRIYEKTGFVPTGNYRICYYK